MSAVEISIIVVSYNTKELTLDCLRSIYNSKISESYEVIVIDNASADGTAAAIRTEFRERILLISANINYGFASGNNEAARIARGSYILLLNPDTLLMAGAVDNLMQFSRKYPDAGIWGGRTLFPDGSLNPASCWQRQTLWSLTSQALGFSSLFRRSTIFNPEGIGGWNRAGQREVDIVSGCFLLIKRDLWNLTRGVP
jgi:GT2 family glycosyltransferase